MKGKGRKQDWAEEVKLQFTPKRASADKGGLKMT